MLTRIDEIQEQIQMLEFSRERVSAKTAKQIDESLQVLYKELEELIEEFLLEN